MKLRIWQQFSSNHSASFTVVGKFDSVEAATKAADEFRIIIASLSNMYEKQSDAYVTEATLIEIAFGKQYGFDWTRHLDWVWDEEQLQQIDHYVIVSNNGVESWVGALYTDKLMAKLGGKVYVEDDKYVISVELKCRLVDTERMASLYKILNDYFIEVRAERSHLVDSPWKSISEELNTDGYAHADAWFGYVHVKDDELTFSRLKFGSIGRGLPALLEFLKREGCTDIEYSISQRKSNEIYGEGKE